MSQNIYFMKHIQELIYFLVLMCLFEKENEWIQIIAYFRSCSCDRNRIHEENARTVNNYSW